MNVQKLRTSNWNSFLSLLALAVFVLLAVGSDPDLAGIRYSTTNEYLGEGIFRETFLDKRDRERSKTTTIHFKDSEGRYHGMTIIKKEYFDRDDVHSIEEVNMNHGRRHGKSKTTYYDGSVSYHCYNNGRSVPCQGSTMKSTSAFSSFQILKDKYPWFLNSLNFEGYDDAYVEAFLDTLESILDPHDFVPESFDAYYQFGLEELEDTPYDSIIVSNMFLSYFEGKQLLKNNELRLAIIDRYRSDGQSTIDMVDATYTHLIDSWYFEHQEFADFCDDLDSCMNSYGPLDLEDPFFIDSVDIRLARSLNGIIEYKEDTTEAHKSAKLSALRELRNQIQDALIAPTTLTVAIQVRMFMQREAEQGDILKRAVLEVYSKKREWLQVPTVTTELTNKNSASSVTLQGLVLEDGGAEVTARGIAYGTVYNPWIYDQTESSGSGTGAFTVNVNGLTEGRYYARTYATNSAGTAYGNCISFTGSGAMGVEENSAFEKDLIVYPNPTSGMTSLRFQLALSKSMVLKVINLKGQIVDHRDLGMLPPGENTVQLDLSSLHGGIYHLQLASHGTIVATQKLLIVH